jgi:hypothetical protein
MTALCIGLELPDIHLRQSNHEEVVEIMLQKLRNGEFSGAKPTKGHFSDMFPAISEGHQLHQYVMQLPQVLGHMAKVNPQDLSG